MKKPLRWALLGWLGLFSFGAQAQNLSVQATFEGLGTDMGYTFNTYRSGLNGRPSSGISRSIDRPSRGMTGSPSSYLVKNA